MALTKKPVTGMKDITPAEMQIREYVMNQIRETYKGFGFSQIETPCVEHIENLTSKQGGDNEKLIFKILKRGEKLNLETAQTEADLVDSGLRYDLTVPLSRYYSNNAANLPKPFKALQIGPVWRADRPQKGRFRQFYQCDIDILGDPTNLAEIELILATTTLLGKVGFKGFTVHINDRRILKGMAKYSGFDEAQYDEVFIILDKMDKIGLEGVREELEKEGFDKACVDKYLAMFEKITNDVQGVRYVKEKLEGENYDLRVVCREDEVDYVVVRCSKGAITNLHLNNKARLFGELSLAPSVREELFCRSIAATRVLGLRYAGIDVLIARNTDTPYIIEVNGQGDHIYQDMFTENKIYTNQIRTIESLFNGNR